MFNRAVDIDVDLIIVHTVVFFRLGVDTVLQIAIAVNRRRISAYY